MAISTLSTFCGAHLTPCEGGGRGRGGGRGGERSFNSRVTNLLIIDHISFLFSRRHQRERHKEARSNPKKLA